MLQCVYRTLVFGVLIAEFLGVFRLELVSLSMHGVRRPGSSYSIRSYPATQNSFPTVYHSL